MFHILILSTCSILQHLRIHKFDKMTIKYRKMLQRTHLVKQSEHNHKKYSLCLQTKYFTLSLQDMCVLYNTLLFSVAATHPIAL
jgi:hypothetical protein